jgi:hypothetical protein
MTIIRQGPLDNYKERHEREWAEMNANPAPEIRTKTKAAKELESLISDIAFYDLFQSLPGWIPRLEAVIAYIEKKKDNPR